MTSRLAWPLSLALSSVASAATLEVGPTRALATPCAAAAVAEDGDTILIDAGTYSGDVCAWKANGLTLEGVGGFAHLQADGAAYGGKGTWVIQGDDTTVRSIRFSGASVPDQNGAGIRLEGAGLTVSHCWFHDNEDGILAGDNPDSDILIEYSLFERNGYGDGYSHNLYINHVRSLTFQFNASRGSVVGHELKSRAYRTAILYNRIADGDDGTGSYQIDLPNGGEVLVLGNLIQQGPGSQNSTMLSFAEEGASNPDQSLWVVNNTFVNDLGRGTFVHNGGEVTAVLVNNLLVGSGTALSGAGEERSDLASEDTALVDRAGGDYHLTEGSPAIDAGEDPGALDGASLWPAWQVAGEAEAEARPVVGALDIGALEYGEADTATGDDSGSSDSGPSDSGPSDSGPSDSGDGDTGAAGKTSPACGCAAAEPGSGLGMIALVGALASRRRRSDPIANTGCFLFEFV